MALQIRASATRNLAAYTLAAIALFGCKAQPHRASSAQANPDRQAAPASQSVQGAWQGNWGGFTPVAAEAARVPGQVAGQGLIIRDCAGDRCRFRIMVAGPGLNGSGDGSVELRSVSEAVLHMDPVTGKDCSLHALRTGTPERIQLEPGSGNCSDFVTPGTSFFHEYPRHSRTAFMNPDVTGCFAAKDPSDLAVCTDAALVKEENDWERFAGGIYNLKHPDAQGELAFLDAAKASIYRHCDRDSNVSQCLHTALAASTAEFKQQQGSFFTAAAAPGDATQGSAVAARIAGSYRRRFANADVQGDHYRSTDTLKLTARPGGEIEYDTHLEFFNGHECNLSGTAHYASNGMFVDQQKQDTDRAPLCTFQIEPGKEGVTFHDPDGACRELNCGARGGFEGAQFSFKDRLGGH